MLYLEQLTGNIGDPREPIVPAAAFERAMHLLQPISDKETLFTSPQSPMQVLTRELQHWLIARQLGCEQLEWQFATAHGEGSRHRGGKPEVPANEPLGECYNIPLPLLLATQKKSRVRRMREKLVHRLRRWGLVRGVAKEHLNCDDTEVRIQTLVDL